MKGGVWLLLECTCDHCDVFKSARPVRMGDKGRVSRRVRKKGGGGRGGFDLTMGPKSTGERCEAGDMTNCCESGDMTNVGSNVQSDDSEQRPQWWPLAGWHRVRQAQLPTLHHQACMSGCEQPCMLNQVEAVWLPCAESVSKGQRPAHV